TVFAVDCYVVELSSEAEVGNLKPDFEKLKEYLCIVTAKGGKGTKYDFVSRYFAVPVGVAEDPVTGSAHCCLAPYWAEQLKKTDFIAYQASSRGGELLVGLAGDRVHIAGQAITFSKGVIRLPVD
ncbi:MAG: PhzF family phenazine biosynthesis protein, partial [Flavisolibacter sp.]|nr:PhzF family phenazine biosynthesis protein [Flavisolibacter sp.]